LGSPGACPRPRREAADGDAAWEIADRIVATDTGGRCPPREDRELFLVKPVHVIVPAFN
jgi:hypothetical protein